jgi:hypothetical protein
MDISAVAKRAIKNGSSHYLATSAHYTPHTGQFDTMEKAIVKALATVNNQTKLVNTTEARRQATIATSYRTWYSKGTPSSLLPI